MGKKTDKSPQQSAAFRLGIDMGGTKILAAVVDDAGKILAEAKQRTMPALGPDGVIQRIVMTAQEAVAAAGLDMADVAAMGIGAPGPVNAETGVVHEAPNLQDWQDVPLAAQVRQALGRPVFVDNDVNIGTLGEYELGAGQGAQHMIGVFVGTGVGGGLIVDGRLHRGFRHAAGEIGHMVLVPGGPLCGCGRRGCLEAVASRTAIEREVRAGIEQGRGHEVRQLLSRAKRGRLTSGVIADALKAGDELMVEVIAQTQYYLGLLSANIVNFFDPEMIVFGGGVVEALGDSYLAPIRETARSHFLQQRDADRVQIVPAVLGDYAGVLGAAILAGQLLAGQE
jgi:glucokinase